MGVRSRRGGGRRVPQASQDVLSTIVLVGLIVLLVYPPFFRGLYFSQEQLATFLYTLVLFMLWWVHKWRSGDVRFFGSTLDYFALAAALAWTLSIIAAVNPRGAIQEALKNLNYFLVYWLVAEQIRTVRTGRQSRVRLILGAMYLSALGVALVGLGAAAGVVHYNGAVLGGRISSTIQYPNSLAAYLSAAFFIGLELWVSDLSPDERPSGSQLSRLWNKIRTGVFASSLALILLTFIFTLSRGAWLVFPFALALFAILTPPGSRFRALTQFATVLASAGAAVPFLAKGVSAQHAGYVGLAAGVALTLAVALGHLGEFYLRQSMRFRVALAGALLAVLTVGAVAGLTLSAARPLSLGHGAREKDSLKALQQGLPDLNQGEDYVLTLDAMASGDAKKPYGWRASVYGYDATTGAVKTLTALTGKPGGDWEHKEAKVSLPDGITRLTIQLSNYYSGTQVTFRNVSIKTARGAVAAQPSFTLAKLLPSALYRRVSDINLQTSSSESRLVFYRDALKMIRDFPVLGMGGRGWASAFMKYQSYGYVSRETHNHFLQTWVETGTLGFLAWLGLWGALVYTSWRLIRDRGGADRLAVAGIVTAGVTIGIHSFIDFNLSLGAISLYLWALLGMAGAARSFPNTPRPSHASLPALAGIPVLLAIALAILSSLLLLGQVTGTRAAGLMKTRQVVEARAVYQRAIAYDPWTASFHIDLGQLTGSMTEIERGIALDSFNPQYQMAKGALYLRSSNLKDGLAVVQHALTLEPYQPQGYQQVAEAYFRIGESLYQAGKTAEARMLFDSVLNVRQQVKDLAATLPPGTPQPYRLDENGPALALEVGRAQALLGARQDAIPTLVLATRNKDTTEEANIWLAALFTIAKDFKKAGPYLAKVDAAGKDVQTRYTNILGMLINP